MDSEDSWEAARPVTSLRGSDLTRAGCVFRVGSFEYRTTGKALGFGGMGDVFLVERRRAGEGGPVTSAVAKVFQAEYLLQVRTDPVTRSDHELVLRNIDLIAQITHEHLLPTLVSTRIADNHLTITPLKKETLRQAIAGSALPKRRRVELLIHALLGLSRLHKAGFIHRDFTLRNILLDDELDEAYLFDFDLSLLASDVEGESYRDRYMGRVFGSPGYSVAPEILDSKLMLSEISKSIDLYAVGTAIYGLFSPKLPYGEIPDMWGLLLRISEGVVRRGAIYIDYHDAVPAPLRPILESCLERDPADRESSVDNVIKRLRGVLDELDDDAGTAVPITHTLRYGDEDMRIKEVAATRLDRTVTQVMITTADEVLGRYGYQIFRALGRVKNHPIYLAAPDPKLLAVGDFPDANIYPKTVTIVNLMTEPDRDSLVEDWMSTYLPVLRDVRQGLMTALYRVTFDEKSNFLLLFSEYVDDARFGTALEETELSVEEALGLGYLVARQVARLHERGIAHNNIGAHSLLLKGLRDSRLVHPAMVGIVSPSTRQEDRAADVRRLATLISSWLSEKRVEATDHTLRPRLEDARSRLSELSGSGSSAEIPALLEVIADALTWVNFNFGVLREAGGDLNAYALMLISSPLYGRLWTAN